MTEVERLSNQQDGQAFYAKKGDSERTASEKRAISSFPKSIDVNPTAKCNLACEFCWGPDHNIADGLNTNQWKNAIQLFAQNGTDSIVFTGGEPLIRSDIGELVRFAKDQGMRVTLSTNTLLLKRKASQVLPFIDEIGVPLDGSTKENNSIMRVGNTRAFQSSVEAMDLLSTGYPEIEVTVRTVVSKVNRDDIKNIGKLLEGKEGQFDRWKLYQFAPVSIGSHHKDKFEISQEEFESIAKMITDQFPKLPIVAYPSHQRVGRYVFLGPEGNIFGVDDTEDYRIVGNLKDINEQNYQYMLERIYANDKNNMHAHLTKV